MLEAARPDAEKNEMRGPRKPMSAEEKTNETKAKKVPKAAYVICVYHTAILVASFALTTFIIGPENLVNCTQPVSSTAGQSPTSTGCHFAHHLLLVFAFLFGMLGSTLSASRIVILALRHQNYQSEKIAWQVLTPIHGGVLAVVGIYVVLGGLLAMVRSPVVGPEFGYFVGGFAFIVGFSSELFVKRLIRATEALFGEQEEKSVDAVAHEPPEPSSPA